MKAFEYHAESFPTGITKDNLNGLGQDGWEMLFQDSDGVYLFRREITNHETVFTFENGSQLPRPKVSAMDSLWDEFRLEHPNTVGTFIEQRAAFEWLYAKLNQD